MKELEARLRALARRARAAGPTVIRAGDLELDPATRQVSRAGVEIVLTAKEFLLLQTLAHRPGQVISRSELRELLWDFAFEPPLQRGRRAGETTSVQGGRSLRARLAGDLRCVGYRLAVDR